MTKYFLYTTSGAIIHGDITTPALVNGDFKGYSHNQCVISCPLRTLSGFTLKTPGQPWEFYKIENEQAVRFSE